MSLVIFLHGASSSGKTTLARAIRAESDRPFIHLSLDHFRDSGSFDPASYPDWPSARTRVFNGLHRSFAAFADAGCDVIVEHILDTADWFDALQNLLRGHRVLFVGIKTPEAVLAQREQQRGDRLIGSAVADARLIHSGLVYDLEVDGTASPDENARQVLAALRSHPAEQPAFFRAAAIGSYE